MTPHGTPEDEPALAPEPSPDTGEAAEERSQLAIEFYDDSDDEATEPGEPRAASRPRTRPRPRTPMETQRRRDRIAAALLVLALAAVAAWSLWPRAQHPSATARPTTPPFEVVRVITGPGRGAHPQFARPMGAAFGPGGSVYVTDSRNGRVCVFDAAGAFVREFGAAGDTGTPLAERLRMPVGIAVDASGTAYVADLRAHAVRVFTRDGRFLRDLATRGDVSGFEPTDAAVTTNAVLVTTTSGIVRFSLAGRFLGSLATTLPGGLDHPNGIAVTKQGTILVSDTNHGRVAALSPRGAVVWVTEGAKLAGSRIGLPRGIAAAQGGGAWVADAFGFDVVQVSPDGTLTARYGTRGVSPGTFQFPNDVDVSGNLMLVTDKENDRVQVLRILN